MSADMLAPALQALGLSAEVRFTANRPRQSILRRLQHQFVVIKAKSTEIIIDTAFREHFELPGKSGAAYRELFTGIPLVFVGSREELLELVTVISHALSQDYNSRDMPLPPWRTLEALMSRWPEASSAAIRAPVPWRSLREGSDGDDGSDSSLGSSRELASPTSVMHFSTVRATTPVAAVFGFDVKPIGH
jgi:uncharacterized protein (TIGR01615 family)